VSASDGGVFVPVSPAAPLNLTEPDDGSALTPFGAFEDRSDAFDSRCTRCRRSTAWSRFAR